MTENQGPGTAGTAVYAEYDFVPVRSDYAALLRAMPQVRTLRALAWCVSTLAGVAGVLSLFLVDSQGEPMTDLAAPLVVAAVVTAVVGFGYSPWGASAAWRRPASREPVRAVLDDQGFRHEGPSGSQSCVWGVVSHVRETAEAYYLYVPNGLGAMVYWLPKRAVPVDQQAFVGQHIRARVRRYRIR